MEKCEMKKVRNIVVIVLSVICVGILVFFVVEFKKYRGVCTGNNTGSSAGTYVGTECIGF